MTAQILTSELSTLIQDSKRKNADIRNAAEKSLSDLKSLPNTSEAQLGADLRRRPNFVRPFLLSCASKNAKLAGTSVACFQRLVVCKGLAPETLQDTLEVLRDCTGLAQDVQLKILQVLPSFQQNYGEYLTKDLLATALHICFILLASKTAVISNTAAATLQQIVPAVIGKVTKEDESAKEQDFVAEVPIVDGSISVMSAALDAYRLLDDICLLAEGDRPSFLHPASMPPNFGLELIEAVLSNHAATVTSHPELVHIIRVRLMPFIIRVLSEQKSFSMTVRAMRLLPIIFNNMLSALPSECEMVLSLLNHMLDPSSSPMWKRVLCLEVFRGLHSESSLVRSMYAHFDEQEGKRSVIKDHLDILVRISSEKPAIIGLGAQSTIPASAGQTEDEMDEMAALQAEGIGGSIGVAVTLRSSTAPGISARLSIMRVPCLDQLDKGDPPQIPPAYLYTLALTCINSFSEGLAKFLLPFTVPSDSRNKRKAKVKELEESKPASGDEEQEAQTPKITRSQSNSASRLPTNPLSLEGNQKHSQIKTSSNMVETCWPALLAAYSTFFHAALDSEYYHALVRSFQKFTQISGLLRLPTPRDAFLTALGKNAVPSSIMSVQNSAQQLPVPDNKDPRRGSRTPNTPAPDSARRLSSDSSIASLNTRNLLCLRALLNLGIALGPVLQAAWSIILETLQQADLVISHLAAQKRQTRSGQSTPTATSETDLLGDIGNEIAAVRIAATRMLESSAELPDESFLDVVASMSGLLKNLTDSDDTGDTLASAMDPRANLFVVENLGKIAEFNLPRFMEHPTPRNGWHIFVNSFLSIVSANHFDSELRIRAAKGLCDLIGITSSSEIVKETKDEMRVEGLVAIARQIDSLNRRRNKNKTSKSCELEIHYMSLETLRSLMEQFGDSLASGWFDVFNIITSVFEEPVPSKDGGEEELRERMPRVTNAKSPKLVRSAFGSLQLICSDFLATVPENCLPVLLNAIYSFCAQLDEFNISLTSTSLFCNVSDHLWTDQDALDLHSFEDKNSINLDSLEIQNFDSQKAEMILRVLALLAEVTKDSRSEIRHAAIHSIYRIFDSCGEKLRPSDWMICQKQVILRLFAYNEEAFKGAESADQEPQNSSNSSFNEAAVILLENTSSLMSNYVNVMLVEDGFQDVWGRLCNSARLLLDRANLALSAAVFIALEKILLNVEAEQRSAFGPCIEITWNIWKDGNPSTHKSPERKTTDNQAALLAYLHCLAALYPLLSDDLKLNHIQAILGQLKRCPTNSSPTTYSDDSDKMTGLQSQIVLCMQNMDDRIPGAVSELIRCSSFFASLAFERDLSSASRGGPTFVAFSKASMKLLEDFITKHRNVFDIYSDGSLLEALQAIFIPISLKYSWRSEGKSPPTWQKATSCAVEMLKVTIQIQEEVVLQPEDVSALWQEILNISNGILLADPTSAKKSASESAADQSFDIVAFLSVFDLLVPALGSSQIPDGLRGTFSKSLFRNSIIHTPHPDDLPVLDSPEVLKNLNSVHMGRVCDLYPSRRSKIAYTCLDKLFGLVARHDSSPERIRLAREAAPFLILRVGIVLKAYILDQPLRGRMPTPASQKKELLYVLRKLVELESEPKAIPDAPGIRSDGKKHLYRVYGFVNKALPVARRDPEVLQALNRVIEVVASDFGID